jgi:hypothetical protein
MPGDYRDRERRELTALPSVREKASNGILLRFDPLIAGNPLTDQLQPRFFSCGLKLAVTSAFRGPLVFQVEMGVQTEQAWVPNSNASIWRSSCTTRTFNKCGLWKPLPGKNTGLR